MRHPLATLFLLLPLASACGGDDHGGHTTDAGLADTAATDALGDAATTPTLNDCAPADYEDRSGGDATTRVVRPRGSTGYTPRCVTIRAGQSVTFEMDFAAHPLVPGIPHGPTAGATSPNPIARQASGTTYAVAFAGAGYFPFYCDRHGHVGMAGVVRVTP